MRVILGHIKMNVLNGISLFVILGIGVDDAFVFIDTYKQMGDLTDPVLRMRKTFQVGYRKFKLFNYHSLRFKLGPIQPQICVISK